MSMVTSRTPGEGESRLGEGIENLPKTRDVISGRSNGLGPTCVIADTLNRSQRVLPTEPLPTKAKWWPAN